jgi:hypothetical protein
MTAGGTESTGFEPEPFSLAALAGQEQLQERIRELENERAGKVLVDPRDLRVFFAKLSRGLFLRRDSEAGQAERRLRDAADGLSHGELSRAMPGSAQAVSVDLSAGEQR